MSEPQDFSQFSMMDLFTMEVRHQVDILNDGLIALETNSERDEEVLASLMRAAHSIKGAARIVNVKAAIAIAHGMEDCFVAAQSGTLHLAVSHIDTLLHCADLLRYIGDSISVSSQEPLSEQDERVQTAITALMAILQPTPQQTNLSAISTSLVSTVSTPLGHAPTSEMAVPNSVPTSVITAATALTPEPSIPNDREADHHRSVRVSVDNLNCLMGLAGESLVEANWLQPFADSLLKLKTHQADLVNLLERLQDTLSQQSFSQYAHDQLQTARQKASECCQSLSDRQAELELFSRRSTNLAERLYQEVIASHMRPFGDSGQGFPRMVRDLARHLGKQVNFEIVGKSTTVDRDILERLETPLTHILHNAIDHGIESPHERMAVGKPVQGTIRIEALHRAGMLSITISDDGRGINLALLREAIVAKDLATPTLAAQLSDAELMDFLFLPGFSTSNTITEVSGRGVGLDVAHTMVREVGGTIRATSQLGKGTTFHLQLPLTLSVLRALLVDIAGEPYAFPLTRIEAVVMLPQTAVSLSENCPYFILNDQPISLVLAQQVLDLSQDPLATATLPVIVISDASTVSLASASPVGIDLAQSSTHYGLVVDRFRGERSLVVRPLDHRLGKVPNISAAALMEDGTPVLIVDTDDLARSIDKLLTSGQINPVNPTASHTISQPHKRILVVDDSITVREMERKLLQNQGYEVDVAVNGMDGWNAVRSNPYDLVITDIDMPRMNGIELVTHIKTHATLKSLPVIIVSYKDRDEDRILGLDAGANYYLTKSSFHDDTLVEAVMDLIGEASGV